MNRLTLLLVDADDVVEGEPDLTVRDAATYLDARRGIADALADAGGAPLTVAVVGPRMQMWVRDLRPLADVREAGLRARVAQRWGRHLPPSLSAGEIRVLGLARLAPPVGDLEAAILDHVLGAPWARTTPGPSHLAELLLADPHENVSAQVTPWLDERLAARWAQWGHDAGRLAAAYGALQDHPVAFRDAVFVRVAARDLDHVPADDLLSHHGRGETLDADAIRQAVRAVLGSRQRAAAIEAGRARLRPTLQAWWRGHLAGEAKPLVELAESIPSTSIEAIEALADWAEETASAEADRRLTEDTLHDLRRRFRASEGALDALDRLRAFVVPDPPPDPDPAWDESVRLDDWVPWLRAYLPYRAALDRLGAPPDELRRLGQQATAFSDWLAARYPALLRAGDALVTNAYQTVAHHLDGGARVVWVIWDNLPAHHADALVSAFAAAGLGLAADPEWRLALLPSVTAVSFPAILAGQLTTTREGRTDGQREALIQKTFTGRSVRFQNTLRGVETLGIGPADVSVLHFTDYDALLHKPMHALSDEREALLARERETIAGRLAETIRRFPRDRPVRLVVTSDHGSTRLPVALAKPISLPDGAEHVESFSSRAVCVPPGTRSSDDVCTRLDPDVTGLDGPVLLARGYHTWGAARSGAGYVHGGALPEEVLVPLLTFSPELAPLTPLGLDLHDPDPLAVGTPGVLRVTVRNPNPTVAVGVRLAVEVAGVEASVEVLRTPIPAESVVPVEVPFTVQPGEAQNGGVSVWLTITAEMLGRPVDGATEAVVPVQSALRTQANDDLFDF